jgi:predicted TIM-barrel enzyme
MLENMHDTPYLRGKVGPEIVASMAIIARAVKAGRASCRAVSRFWPAQISKRWRWRTRRDWTFIRAEGFAFAHVADEGIIQSSAAELLRYRRHIGADGCRSGRM